MYLRRDGELYYRYALENVLLIPLSVFTCLISKDSLCNKVNFNKMIMPEQQSNFLIFDFIAPS